MIYYYKYVNIPLLKIDSDGIVWICLDMRVQRKVIDLIKKLLSMNIDFFLTSKIDIYEKEVYQERIQVIIEYYLAALTNNNFFTAIHEMDFDYVGNMVRFMDMYDSNNLLSSAIKKIFKNFIDRRYFCYLRKKDIYYKVPEERIRDFFSTLERDVKISSLFNI